jgi:hypothetical protein
MTVNRYFADALVKFVKEGPDGHFNFLHLWPGQNPPLDSVVIA